MVWARTYGENLRTQVLSSHGAVVISPKSTVGLFSNFPDILCVPCEQEGFLRLLLSLSYCIVVPADFILDDILKRLSA